MSRALLFGFNVRKCNLFMWQMVICSMIHWLPLKKLIFTRLFHFIFHFYHNLVTFSHQKPIRQCQKCIHTTFLKYERTLNLLFLIFCFIFFLFSIHDSRKKTKTMYAVFFYVRTFCMCMCVCMTNLLNKKFTGAAICM